ncbi:hypothetical protein B484DRAFT_399192 [Ochromonadaceae sp. CCMP2298]|nr:hypothetical protein B484DRAFT_399192 [Ochromonadaceae sp. CCMP2298]
MDSVSPLAKPKLSLRHAFEHGMQILVLEEGAHAHRLVFLPAYRAISLEPMTTALRERRNEGRYRRERCPHFDVRSSLAVRRRPQILLLITMAFFCTVDARNTYD